MPYVNHRWLGGLLTNFQTINQRIKRLHDLERYEADGQLALLPTRERLSAEADLAKLRANLGGVKNMTRTPDAIFVVDLKTEVIGVREAQRLRIPIIGLVDTNCDPDGIDFVIPGNDDAIRSCDVITRALGNSIAAGARAVGGRRGGPRPARAGGRSRARQAEEQARREAEEAAQAPGRRRGQGRRGGRAGRQGRPGRRRRRRARAGAAPPRRPTAPAAAPTRRDARPPTPRPRPPTRRSPSDAGIPRPASPNPKRSTTVSTTISAADVKALREKTGAGMMDCKNALTEADGDADKAEEILRVKMGNKIGKLAGRETSEGTVQAYIHANGKVGVLVQVECNTDFVAKNDDFIEFAKDLALHIAASPQTKYVTEDEIPQEDKDAEARVFEQQAADKPENIRPKIVEGKLKAWYKDVVLLDQEHVNGDKHDGKTIEQLRADLSAKTGENVVIKRFVRFAVGE